MSEQKATDDKLGETSWSLISDLSSVTLIVHPLIQHKITSMRDINCEPREFGFLLRDCGLLLGYEATRLLQMSDTRRVETPRGVMESAPQIAEADPVIVAILRAGLVMVEGMRDIFHTCSVGHIGLSRQRDENNGLVRYYSNLPVSTGQRFFVVDPIIATGLSISTAVDIVKENGVPDRLITAVALLGAESGIRRFSRRHPHVHLFIGACDAHLDTHQYVVPGLGDMGDRLFGTI
jgi:uracil phosphoribosyltransferase